LKKILFLVALMLGSPAVWADDYSNNWRNLWQTSPAFATPQAAADNAAAREKTSYGASSCEASIIQPTDWDTANGGFHFTVTCYISKSDPNHVFDSPTVSYILPLTPATCALGGTLIAGSSPPRCQGVSPGPSSSGYWAPAVLIGGVNPADVTFSVLEGTYTVAGDQVLGELAVTFTSKGTHTGAIQFTLPIPDDTTIVDGAGGATTAVVFNFTGLTSVPFVQVEGGHINLYQLVSGSTGWVTNANLTNTSSIRLHFQYRHQ